MNLRGIANSAIQVVNPDQKIIWRQSTGYTVNENYEQVPAYEEHEVAANIQALSGADLRQVDALNLQGTMRKVYLFGDVRAISRPDAEGGDLLLFPQVPGGEVQTWLVNVVSETWPGWCCVIVTLQND
ncbi:MAG: hypothetical protein NC112_09015 [Oxalobacter formigenes]|nr:hypothetical protein [Oxalobacter formigenes]